MFKVLTGLFKRIVCLPLGIIMFLILLCGFYIIPESLYWLVSGRSFVEDTIDLLNYATT